MKFSLLSKKQLSEIQTGKVMPEGMPESPSKISPHSNVPVPDNATLAHEFAMLKIQLDQLEERIKKSFPQFK